jgi:hypothetical protein
VRIFCGCSSVRFLTVEVTVKCDDDYEEALCLFGFPGLGNNSSGSSPKRVCGLLLTIGKSFNYLFIKIKICQQLLRTLLSVNPTVSPSLENVLSRTTVMRFLRVTVKIFSRSSIHAGFRAKWHFFPMTVKTAVKWGLDAHGYRTEEPQTQGWAL